MKEAVEAERRKFELEMETIRRMTIDERSAELLYQDITENILNLRCPRCNHVFVDFSGCFALTCVFNRCGAGFCAWCLRDCGSDAHAHVANCPENRTGDVYGRKEDFDQHHRARKERRVEAKLKSANLSQTAMNILRTKLSKDLRDLGIRVQLPGW